MERSSQKDPRISSKVTLKNSNLKFILQILESKESRTVASIDYGEVLRLLRVNRIPLLMVKDNETHLFRRDDSRKELMKEKAKYRRWRDEYEIVRERFSNEGIENILFKSTGLPPSFPCTSDNLDVLIKSNYEEKARKILQESGYAELRNIEEPRKFLFRRFRGGEFVSAIHLHTQIGWGVPFLDNDFVWNGNYRISDDDSIVTIPSLEVGLLVTFAHTFYEDKEVNLLNLLRFHRLLEQNVNWESAITQAERRGWSDGFFFTLLIYSYLEEQLFKKNRVPNSVTNQALKSLDRFALAYFKRLRDRDRIEMPFEVSFLFSKILYYKKLVKDKKRDNLKKFYDIVSTLLWGFELKLKTKLSIYLQPSMLVTFSGVDGSGKTAQITSLLKALNVCELKTKYFWYRYGSSKFTASFIKIGKLLFSNTNAQSTSDIGCRIQERKSYLRNRLIRLLWSWFVLVELSLKYSVEVRLSLLLGRIVVCDRYILDAVVELDSYLADNNIHNRVYSGLLKFLNPSPSRAFLLDTSPEIVMDRNHENIPKAHLEKQILLYCRMAKEHNVTIIDAGQFEGINDNLVHAILTDYYNNFRSLAKGLLLANPNQLNPGRKQ